MKIKILKMNNKHNKIKLIKLKIKNRKSIKKLLILNSANFINYSP